MRYVHVEFRFPPSIRHPMHDFLDCDEGWRSELLTWRRLDDGTLATLFRVTAPREPYLERLRAVDSIERFEIGPASGSAAADGDGDGSDGATAEGDETFYLRAHETLDGPLDAFLGAFLETEFLSVPPVVYRSEGRLALGVVGPPDQLRGALSALPDAIDVDVDRIGSYDGGSRLAGVEVTDRQAEALRAARRAGYYDVPRTGSVADVADALDCSSSTAGSHLRKAEAALVDAYLDG
ncbi:HTH DNA binding domain-containing protein [Halorubrum aquaticum]|uniref:HTH DNA binding domain-containing protein n=1 Tax=Halorubrum aquaticum TaxID=387340 RepID=A0A1I2Z2W5_9EURY|nr:helix-turn-helix domain-containing protein [Halorubrum aquaticum]SFH32134.1 HTH DNA binding domain-containing protein [Halorubrum aquaticum]